MYIPSLVEALSPRNQTFSNIVSKLLHIMPLQNGNSMYTFIDICSSLRWDPWRRFIMPKANSEATHSHQSLYVYQNCNLHIFSALSIIHLKLMLISFTKSFIIDKAIRKGQIKGKMRCTYLIHFQSFSLVPLNLHSIIGQ